LAAGLAACGSSSKKPPPPPTSSPAPTASVSQQASHCGDLLHAPTCVLFGVSADSSVIDSVQQAIGQKFDLVYFFDSVDSGDLPTSDERQAVADGQTLHINIESREFSKSNHPDGKWSDVAAG